MKKEKIKEWFKKHQVEIIVSALVGAGFFAGITVGIKYSDHNWKKATLYVIDGCGRSGMNATFKVLSREIPGIKDMFYDSNGNISIANCVQDEYYRDHIIQQLWDICSK